MAKRGGKRKKVPNDTVTPRPTSLKLTLPARRDNTASETIPIPAAPSPIAVDLELVGRLSEPATSESASTVPILQPVPALAVHAPTTVKSLSNCYDTAEEAMEQDIEILSIQHPKTPPMNLLDNFFTLEDSQDESEVSPPIELKPKPSRKSLSARTNAIELDKNVKRMSYIMKWHGLAC